MKLSLFSLLSAILLAWGNEIASLPVAAQIAVDGTTSTTVTPTDAGVQIDNGDRNEGNLFHSFAQFSIPSGQEAFFNNNTDISNIFSRVTGGSVSNINGLIRANGAANLFLINPAGIIFGEGAALQLGGSFYGSTADSIVFPDGEFSATDLDNPPLITVNAPIGLGFRDNPGEIANQSVANSLGLQVLPEQTLALVGGDIRFAGGLINAPGGNIELGGLTETGIVSINEDGSLSFGEQLARANVSLNEASVVQVSSNGGGSITINANNFELLRGSQLLAGILPGTQLPEAQAGDIIINATEKVTIDSQDTDLLTLVSNGAGDLTDLFTQGSPGNIRINSKILEGNGNFNIGSANNGEGNVGDVEIFATESISLIGRAGLSSGLASIVGFSGTGDGGKISLTTTSLTISDAVIATSTLGAGNAGDIQFDIAESLDISGVSQLQAASISGGNAGNIIINGENADISLTGENVIIATVVTSLESFFSEVPEFIDLLEALEFSPTVGSQGGDIIITARNFTADNDVSITTSTVGKASEERLANAGNIEINVIENLAFSRNSQLSSETFGQGNAGNIALTVGDNIIFDDTSRISTAVLPKFGDLAIDFDRSLQGGDINIISRSLSLTDGSLINASTLDRGNAGAISINTQNDISIGSTTSNPSGILSAVDTGAIGNGGEINIITNNLFLNRNGAISATTFGQGNTGLTSINATGDIFLNGAVIDVSNFGQGNARNLSIVANTLNLDESFILAVNQPLQPISIDESRVGGNIDLEVSDTITLRDNSIISASAGENASGGNININTNFIIAFPSSFDGNDIRADAQQGRGGNIRISAESVFGIAENSTLSPLTNDINASSQVSGLEGTIAIETPDINPLRVASELPNNPVSANVIATNACAVSSTGETSGLIVTGKGGIPPEIIDTLTADTLIIDQTSITFNPIDKNQAQGHHLIFPNAPDAPDMATYVPSHIKPVINTKEEGEIYAARGIMKQEDGTVYLTAYPTSDRKRPIAGEPFDCGSN